MKLWEVVKGHLKAVAVCAKHLVALHDRMTLQYPEEELALGDVYRGYVKLDANKCVGCALCAKVCPANAITMRRVEGTYRPQVNYGRCIFCGFCVDACPVDALTRTEVHDLAFYRLEDTYFDAGKLSSEPRPPRRKPAKRVVAVLHERKGVRHVRAD